MKKCSTCKRKFYHKEFVWHGGEGQSCSIDCLPDGVLDETYAMDYAFLLEHFNGIEEDCWPITSYEERQELMSEIDDCIRQSEEYEWGDLEGSFYKHEPRKLHNDFLNLEDKVWSCFLTKGSLLRDIGFYVHWEGIKEEISLQAANKLKQLLQDVISEANCRVSIIYNGELDPINYSRNIVYVDGNEDYEEDDWKYPVVEQLYNAARIFFESFSDLEVDLDYLFDYQELAICPKCGCMEPWEDFGYEEKYHMLVCSTC